VTSAIILYATWEQNLPTYYNIAFIDWNGSILKVENVVAGGNATAPANPYRAGYIFIGWDKNFTNIQSNINIYALYEKVPVETFTVTFIDWDGTVIDVQVVNQGDDAVAPFNPFRAGYTFIGWDKNFTNVQGDLIVYALYTEDKADARDSDDDDSIIWWLVGGGAALFLLFLWLLLRRGTYKVIFMTISGEKIKSFRVSKNSKIELKKCPNTLIQWYQDQAFSRPWNFEKDKVKEDIILYSRETF
jgi:hypothetical protein